MIAGSVGEALYPSQISSNIRGHTQGRSPMFAGSVGEALHASQISSHTRGHTQGRSPMFAVSVGEALHGSHVSSHTRGHTVGSPMFSSGLSESLALSLISTAIGRSLGPCTLPKIVISTGVTG